MLAFFTVLIMLIVAYVYLVEGLANACAMCINTLLAGVIAFEFWEPLADQLDGPFSGTFLAGYEDALCLGGIFCIALAGLRFTTNYILKGEIDLPEVVNRVGGAAVGVVTGYLAAGFLLCLWQTLPLHQNFMYFDWKYDPTRSVRRMLPPDRVWLALMHKAGHIRMMGNSEDPTFDEYGTFEMRYARYRRYTDDAGPMPYGGEFERELGR